MDETKDLSEPNESGNNEESKSAISADLIRGHINTIILRTLYERDKYGYEIIEEIEKKSHGQYSLKQPTLYSALKRLESQGYINAYWKTDEVSLGGRRKYYTLTDSGREITEKNQAEWEYSRTVIDNLISDRSFDFTQPPPTAVDFKILKKSTSRVPVVKDGEDDDDEDEKEDNSLNRSESFVTKVAEPVEVVYVSSSATQPQNTPSTPSREEVPQPLQTEEQLQQIQTQIQEELQRKVEQQVKEQLEESLRRQQEETAKQAARAQAAKEAKADDEQQRKLVHENYMRLISEPVKPSPQEVDVVPVSDNIDTHKLIYNNKPETERDYKNLINNIFDKTVTSSPRPPVTAESSQTYETPTTTTVKLEDVALKAENDGLKVNSSDYVVDSRKKTYNKGGTLFKSSLIISIILLLEFALSLIFKDRLGVSIAYPFVILALAAAQLLIFGVLYYTDIGKNTRKPSSNGYLSVCIIVTVILIFIIFIVSLLLNVNFSSAGDITAKIILPCIVALNIPLFAVCFYAFSRN